MIRLPMRDSWREKEEAVWRRVREHYGLTDETPDNLDGAIDAMREAISQLAHALGRTVRQGERLLALCPFHDDRHIGSFMLSTRTGWFKCWSCGATGGLHKLMHKLGIDDMALKEAMKDVDFNVLASFLEGTKRADTVDTVKVLPEGLLTRYNKRPKRLLEKNHPARLIDALDIGFDTARMRITFPVRRATGELVAIQTRAVATEGKELRWKFYKKEILDDLDAETIEAFGLRDYEPPRHLVFFNEHNVFLSLAEGRISRPVVLCEGPGHALRVMECGYPCVASFGTSLADPQADRLIAALLAARTRLGLTPTLVLATDGDKPGRMSAFKTAMRIGPAVNTLIVDIPREKDPEDLDVPTLRGLLARPRPLSAYMMEETEVGDWAREAIEKESLRIVELMDRVERKERWMRKTAWIEQHETTGEVSLRPAHGTGRTTSGVTEDENLNDSFTNSPTGQGD